PGADGVAVGGETAGEPVAGGTVDRQEGGVCDTQGQETSWENSGFVAEPVSPKRFLCSPRGSAHAPHISACPKKLTEHSLHPGPYRPGRSGCQHFRGKPRPGSRSEEHTSELQSRENLVCRL